MECLVTKRIFENRLKDKPTMESELANSTMFYAMRCCYDCLSIAISTLSIIAASNSDGRDSYVNKR